MTSPPSLAPGGSAPRRSVRGAAPLFALVLTLAFPGVARASFMPPEVEDKLATFLALFVIFVVPVVLIVLFWMVHVLPEKIAHKRHHPQFEAIRTLCLLSLAFGGLLWPIAWLWAYSKPVFYKMAYGQDTDAGALGGHDEPVPAEEAARVATLRERIARLEQRVPPKELDVLRADVDALEAKFAQHEVR
jgi:heme/copper-type cytochrome/quinol oxidase subunit 2